MLVRQAAIPSRREYGAVRSVIPTLRVRSGQAPATALRAGFFDGLRAGFLAKEARNGAPRRRGLSCLTDPPHKTKVVTEVVSTFSSFQVL